MNRPTGDAPISVTLVSHSLTTGGAERFAATLATHLDRDRFQPRLVLAVDKVTYSTPPDVPVHVLGYGSIATLPRTIRRLRRRLGADPPDVVLSNVLSTNCLTGAALGSGDPDRSRWVARVGLAPAETDPWPQRLWARRVYPRAAAVVANADRMAAAVAEVYPRAPRPIAIPNPTDFQSLERRAADDPIRTALEGEITLLSIGRLRPQKRHDLQLEALAELRQTWPVRLWICGDGPLEGELRTRAAALGVADVVDFLGFCENPFPLMRQADLFLLTSDAEGLPNALIEAQGLGLPAVATRCPFGPDEIVDDAVTGQLVPVGDAGAVVRAVSDVIANPDRRTAMGRAAATRARERFSIESVLPRWMDLLAAVAEGR